MEARLRFLFRGCDRETGNPLEGHVEASDTEAAYQVLSDHGIVTETLDDDPRPLNLPPEAAGISQFAEALDSALDLSSSQVAFDDLTQKYRGKKVWVIDRDKIRRRVAQVVDSTLAVHESELDGSTSARERVADAINGLFHDTNNIASQHNAELIAQMRAIVGAAGQGVNSAGLTEQIGRLTGVVEQAEGLIAAMSAALRNIESGGVPRRRFVGAAPSMGSEQNEVLREIFQSNLELRRVIAKTAPLPVKAA